MNTDGHGCFFVFVLSAPFGYGSEKISREIRVQIAVALYRGDFLKGLLLSDSVEFEDWAMIRRERGKTQTLAEIVAGVVGE